MAKPSKTLNIRIPPYQNPRNDWRRAINKAAFLKLKEQNLSYTQEDHLEVHILLYSNEKAILKHDIDNRLKDILDALQGRAGGTKKIKTMREIIPNDNQIYRVIIEKSLPPIQSLGMGHLTIRKTRKRAIRKVMTSSLKIN
jgi:Holliday junction resolvase RusA-like endonuclease